MFDWFRKKKKNAPEAQAPEVQSPDVLSTDVQNSEARGPEVQDHETRIVKDQLPEDQLPEDQLQADHAISNADGEPESEAAPAEPAPVTDPVPLEETRSRTDEISPAEPPSPEPASEDASPKKGLFARFRKKISPSEIPVAKAQTEDAREPEQPDDIEPISVFVEDQAEDVALEVETEQSFPEAIAQSPAPETEPDPLEPQRPEPAVAEKSPQPPQGDILEEIVFIEETPEEDGEPKSESPGEETEDEEEEVPRTRLLARFKEKLSATRNRLAGRIESLLSSVRAIDDDLLDELEELLITADLGVQTTNDLLFKIRGQVAKKELSDAAALKEALKKRIMEMVDLPCPPRPQVSPMVIMVVGVNGVGKTTTIAKLARRLKEDDGQKVLLAAGDTFRSAAVEQLSIWAERLGVDIVSQPTGADASAVVFDALTAARARKADVVIIDTAGRLHTKVNLMDELKKIKRVAGKALPGAPHHTILVLDGNTGQNAQRQAQTFHEAVGVDSIIVTKLDGTAKGGVIVSITNELKIPIAFVGLGESFDDLQPFDARAFTEAVVEP